MTGLRLTEELWLKIIRERALEMKSPMKRGPHLRYIRRNREAHRGNGTRTERQGAEYYHPEQRAYTFIHHSLHSTFNYNVGMFTNCMNECPAQVGVLSMRPVPGS